MRMRSHRVSASSFPPLFGHCCRCPNRALEGVSGKVQSSQGYYVKALALINALEFRIRNSSGALSRRSGTDGKRFPQSTRAQISVAVSALESRSWELDSHLFRMAPVSAVE